MKKDDSVYLRHIIDSFERIEHYLEGISKEEFFKTGSLQDAVIRQLEIMGEAARNLSDDLRLSNPQVPWRQMVGLRNRVIHAYFEVNLQIIWEIVKGDLPDLKQEIKRILENNEESKS